MHVESEKASAAPKPDLHETAGRFAALTRELADVKALEAENEAAAKAARKAAETAARSELAKRDAEAEAEIEAARVRLAAGKRRLDERKQSRLARIARAAARRRERLNAIMREEERRRNAEFAVVKRDLDAENEKEAGPLDRRLRGWERQQPEIAGHFQSTVEMVRKFAVRHRWAPDETPDYPGPVDVEAQPDEMAADAQQAFDEAVARMEKANGWWGADLARLGPLIVLQVILLVAGAGAVLIAINLGTEPADAKPILGAVLVLTAALQLAGFLIRSRYRRIAREVYERTTGAAMRFERHAVAALKHLDERILKNGEAHRARLNLAEQRVDGASLERSAPTRRQIDWLEKRREGAEARQAARHAEALRLLEEEERRRRSERERADAAAREKGLAAERDRLAAVEAAYAERAKALRERRETALADFTRFANAIDEVVKRGPPPWEGIAPAKLELPNTFPEFVSLGRLRIALDGLPAAAGAERAAPPTFDLPVATSFPEHGSLLVRHGPGDRDRALQLLMNSVLRTLISFPAARVRLTIIDPVGLGQSFSSLMHLADHDEALVNSRIWTETSHIERRLADLTEHIEKVIQKYLRNRYHTIGEYNAEAGDLQEPYHFVVIADFPAGFNDLCAERLASILSSGPRCGVYTLIAHDMRQEAPPPLSLDLLRGNGPVVQFDEGRINLEGPALARGELSTDPPPAPDYVISLLDRVGKLSVAAARVELPFRAVTPGDAEIWSLNTETGLRVPIGRTGAERLQYFDLGRGTAQHALVAGRTGSGKSTLFHVMVTNMALWFSPDELQFYLIDFKKGVEFKVYATEGLPHARVVAIESDREFGLSVLKAVDAELTRRGDLFRAAGVQDLASYRRKSKGEILPRTLLLIDEFQEFFTDDDAVAHDAAVLLDRFVRQGRAFGIHVVLGSQTLSGIYTLARGTLGQMGVRVALQCNEADSYLILSEDNGVARLLSRPGEAIYNDKSGLLEGNNPFQIVWLTDEEQRRNLRRVAERTAATPPRTARETVVFEGNQPADILRNRDLLGLVSGAVQRAGPVDRVWIGEPNAIKGPTEARFLPVSGSNLLVVGQRRDAAFAILSASVFSLAARYRAGGCRIVVLDGGGHEPEFAKHFEDLLAAVPGRVERFDLLTTPQAVKEVSDLVKAREDASADRTPVFLFVFGVQRLRMLRREDDFGSFSKDEAESSGEQFGTILSDGPPRRVHTIVWCDTVPNLQRTLSRKAMREFDMRVLFQMSASDSSELIESSAANNLGLSSALLAVESLGTFEKFRPYAVPGAEVMKRLTPAAL